MHPLALAAGTLRARPAPRAYAARWCRAASCSSPPAPWRAAAARCQSAGTRSSWPESRRGWSSLMAAATRRGLPALVRRREACRLSHGCTGAPWQRLAVRLRPCSSPCCERWRLRRASAHQPPSSLPPIAGTPPDLQRPAAIPFDDAAAAEAAARLEAALAAAPAMDSLELAAAVRWCWAVWGTHSATLCCAVWWFGLGAS